MKTLGKIKWRDLLAVVLVVVVMLVFWPLKDIYFQQDRWLVIGKILVDGPGYFFRGLPGFYRMVFGEGRVAAKLLAYLLLAKNPFSVLPSIIFTFIVHSLNSLLVFILAKKLTNKIFPSFIAAVLFAVNGVSFNAVTWSAAATVTLPATTLILLSLYKYFSYLKNSFKKDIILAFFFLFLSLHFKEVGIFLFILYPIALAFFKRIPVKVVFGKFWLVILILLGVVFYRITSFKALTVPTALYLTGAYDNYLSVLIGRIVFYPLTSFSQLFIPAKYFISFSRNLTDIFYPFFTGSNYLLVAETVVLDMASLVLTAVLFFVLYSFTKKMVQKQKGYLFFFVVLCLLSFAPYAIIQKSFSYLDSRFYYLGMVGASLILSIVLANLKIKKFAKKVALFAFLIFFLFSHVLVVRAEIKKDVVVSKERKMFISQLKEIKSTLNSNENVFYITGDGDYYLPGNKVPFQSGVGYTLMVLYYDSGKIPGDFLRESYLFEIGSQGYKEIDEKGFGYFSSIDKLKELVKKDKLTKDTIIGLYYNSKTGKVADITKETISEIY